MLFNARNNGFKFNDYSSMVLEARRTLLKEERIKIITPKQIFQRLAIAVAQVKTGNTSENLLCKIYYIMYSVFRDRHRQLFNLFNKIKLKKSDKYVALSNLSIYYEWKNIKYNKFETSAPTWNNIFELPDGLYSESDIQGYFDCISKKHETETDNSPIRIYVNKIKNRITFKIKTWYYFKHLTHETMKLLENTEKKKQTN